MIIQGSIWEYQGNDGSPRGLHHTVIQAGKKEIIAWSEATDAIPGDVAGFSWMGGVGEFLQEFKHVCNPKGGPK